MKYPYFLTALGLYYLVTGFWSVIDIEGFSEFTGYSGSFFLKHMNGILFVALGMLFIVSSLRKDFQRWMYLLGAFATLGVAISELYYVPKIGNPLPFWVDFFIESGFFFALLFAFIFTQKRKEE